MPYWLALLTTPTSASGAERAEPGPASQQQALGWWALQFTPRVALLEEAVIAEVQASQRLFGGEQALRERIGREAAELGCTHMAWASNGLAALALARGGVTDGFGQALPALLDALPLHALSAVVAHEPTLARLGCRTLGQVRALPRGGLSRRFGKDMLTALDQAHGHKPQAHAWLDTPDVFDARLELPERVELAPTIMTGARRLLTQMSGWLMARHAGVSSFTLTWVYDFHRGRDAPAHDAITIRTAEPTRHIDHIARLLSEHLAKVKLAAPVEALRLRADEVVPLPDHNGSLLPDEHHPGDSLQQLLERLSARLGADQVLRPCCRPDHRPEHVQSWQPAHQPTRHAPRHEACDTPQPTWLLDQPMPLTAHGERPQYQGALTFLAGPYRIESGWWDHACASATRDYFVVAGERAGLLWVFRERLGMTGPAPHAVMNEQRSGWYLHGIFG